MKLAMIVAIDEEGGMGKDNELPWYCKEDFAYFKEMTEGATVVMGMNTYLSLPMYPAGLPNRQNLVICRDPAEHSDNVFGVKFVTQEDVMVSDQRAWLLGGAQTFINHNDQIDIVSVTRMPGTYDCDTFIDIEDYTNGMAFLERKDLTSEVWVELFAAPSIIPEIREALGK